MQSLKRPNVPKLDILLILLYILFLVLLEI